VALATSNTIIAELTVQTRKTHSEQLMPHIEQLLTMGEVDKSQLEAIAVSIGPGSFTGLRIGLATAKAMAYALSIPLIGVPTLEALAYGCPVPGAILAPTLDAQKGNIYLAIYEWKQGELQEVSPAKVIHHKDAFSELVAMTGNPLVLGEAVALFKDEIAEYSLAAAAPNVAMPRAANVALVGEKYLEQKKTIDVMTAEPLYIRRSEAEELWEKRRRTCP
jgi:tRNA threonylcarbamoyladenosine biosynthesis protein TsaB